ncbi:MAG: hypothetical protein ABIZ80_00910 [Bryobacteraceae bacterium]
MQNAFTILRDPRDGVGRVTRAINSVSEAMKSDVDAPVRDTAEELSQTAVNMVDSMTPGFAAENGGDAMSGRKR